MKKNFIYSIWLSVSLFLISCTDLSETFYSTIPQDQYGSTTEEINSLIGPAYGTINAYTGDVFANLSPWVTGDDLMVPARGLDWYSGGINLRTHTHEWSARETPNCWRFSQVTTINKIIKLLDEATIEIENKDRIYAELRGLRAFWYFYMLDHLGNIPIVTSFDITELPTNNTRKEVYGFVESELLAIENVLTEEKSMNTYTKFTKWVAYTLLAKFYLNAEVYTGTPQWEKCITYCQKVIDSNLYELEPDIFNCFKVNNESSVENIWSIPYDADYFNGFNPYQCSWHYASYQTFDQQYSSWNGICAVPSFVKAFDPEDARYKSFLIGIQYKSNGEPLYTRDGVTPLNFTVEVADFANATENEGARLFKWEVEKNARGSLNNDFAIFRYSDILLMKAECLLRLGNEPEARTIVNQVRARNFQTPKPYEALTLDILLRERAFEFVFEGWRRNDLIRFDRFKDAWDFKPEDPADRHTYLFPIPLDVMDKNPNLKQNPGY
ncbi:MAG: RagB/SusD family nutrient uptake outer membrane protein [Tannerella sp.]|jgi:hypothetical protein|nr:RagB/SusD family nutrient uptake outer membrane protein [Tannerella sp.]